MNARQIKKKYTNKYIYKRSMTYENLLPSNLFSISKFRLSNWIKAFDNKNGRHDN